MGNSAAQPLYFGADIPDNLSPEFVTERRSLQATATMMNTPEEEEHLKKFRERVNPEDIAESPELVDFVSLACLRFRRYDHDTAWARFEKYIAWRREAFGHLGPQDIDASDDPEAAAQGKATTTRSMLDLKVMNLLEKPTAQGQAVVLIKLCRTKPELFAHHARQVCKMAHFVFMEALRRIPSAQVKGVIFLSDFTGVAIANIDRKVPPKMGKLLQGILPVRLAGMLLCNPNMVVRIVLPLAKMFMSEKLASRFHVIQDSAVLGEELGLDRSLLPVDVGGEVDTAVDLVGEWDKMYPPSAATSDAH